MKPTRKPFYDDFGEIAGREIAGYEIFLIGKSCGIAVKIGRK